MKKIFVIFALAIFLINSGCKKEQEITPENENVVIQAPFTIPNGNFESWTNLKPDSWVTNSCPACAPAYETYIVQQDSNPYQGQFAAKFIYNNVYPATAENKFVLNGHPDSLTAYVKSDLYGNDTVSIKIFLLYNSVIVDSGIWLGTTTISNYSQIVLPITQQALFADSAQIFIQGGNKLGFPMNSTEFWVDDLQLH